MTPNTLCIVGAGTMGSGIAQVAAQVGLRVCLLDTSEDALARSGKLLAKSLRGAVDREKLSAEQAEAAAKLITWHADYEPLASADWVIEAVFEDFDAKAAVLREVADRVRDGVPVATNTSTIPIHQLAGAFGNPHVFLGMHFFNPPPAMKLVEIIPGEHTLPSVTEAALRLCDRMERIAKIAPDIPGFIVNRVFGALTAAAIDVWANGAAAEDVDDAIELGLGHRMGPLKTADLVGLDVMLALLQSLSDRTACGRFSVPEELVRLVEEGKLGRKSGEGFYSYALPD